MLKRREFVLQTAGAILASSLAAKPRVARAQTAARGPGAVDLGFSLYGAKSLPLSHALKVCADAGFRNVELALLAGFPTEPKVFDKPRRQELRDDLSRHRLSVSALMLGLSLHADDDAHAKNLESLKQGIQVGHDLLGGTPPLIETILGGKPAQWEASRERMASRLGDWARIAREEGAVIAIKGHVAHAVNHPERLLWLLEQVNNPAVQVAYDYSHFQLQGLQLEGTLKSLLKHTRFIHIKDAQGDASQFRFLLPGEGTTDYPAYFQLLASLEYRGPVVVEVSSLIFNQPGYNAEETVRKCAKALKL
jgi:inosose dehydratase